MGIAFVFSGQGSQYIGMGKELYENIPLCREVFDRGNSILDFNIKDLIFNGDKDVLNITENTQPAILMTSIAAMMALEKSDIKADIVAGLSLGEYTALIASKTLSFEDGLALVKKRGRFMQEAVPVDIGKMVAVIGLPLDKLNLVVQEASNKGIVEIANYNTKNQIVIGGEKEAVDLAKDLAIKEGAKRVIELKVSGPFHTSLLEEASIKLKEELKNIKFNDPIIKIISNVTADFVNSKEDIKDLLTKQVKTSVRLNETIERMISNDIDTFIEIGPGRVLSSFIREIAKDKEATVKIFNVEDMKSLEKTIKGVSS